MFQTLQVVDDHIEVTYNITAEAAGGLVSARDFINVRSWEALPNMGMFISYGIGCTHYSMPVQKNYVR